VLKLFANRMTNYLTAAPRRHPLVRLFILLVLILPVLLVAIVSYLTTERDLTDSAFSRRQTIAYLAAAIVKEKLDRITDVGISLATRVRFRQLVAAKKWTEASEILADVPKDFPFIETVFLSDPAGTLMANVPELADTVGTNRAYRDWYRGVSRDWKPYVSEVYQRLATPRTNIITIALPIRAQDAATVTGILGLRVRLENFREWIKDIQVGPSGFVYLVDRKGQLVAHPQFLPQGQITNFSEVPVVAKALRGESGVEVQVNPIEKEERVSAYEPVTGYGWGVIATQPTATAFALRRNALNRLVLIYGIIVLLSGGLAAAILNNLAQRKKAEEELREKNAELERQSRCVEEANRLKSEFLANMSHELRTPLNAITGFSELMIDGKVGPISSEQAEFLGDILSSSKHLLALINDVLDLAKVEAGKMEFYSEPVSLTKLIGEVTETLRAIAAEKKIVIGTDVAAEVDQVSTDPAKLKQVLYNYLSNALKFTPEGGTVIVRARPETSSSFRIEVEDNGIGIRDEDIGKLFSEFRQLDSGIAKKSQGTGLGLALCKRMVEAQGGSVGVQSTFGKGSVFYIVLPRFGDREEPLVEPTNLYLTETSAPTILIIEDGEQDREWLSRTLAEAGYRIETAATAAEALAQCREKSFDAITLDLILPDMGGWELCHAIRSEGRNHKTPIIVVSVVGKNQTTQAFPISDYLVKPVEIEDLLAALRRARVQPGDKRKVLVVDDDPKILKLAEIALKQLDCAALCVSGAEGGLKAAEHEQFAAVVLDLLMPGTDGFEFLERFRQTPRGVSTPVIIWTNKEITPEDRLRLQLSAQSIALKSHGGVSAVLRELQRHLRPEAPT